MVSGQGLIAGAAAPSEALRTAELKNKKNFGVSE